MEKNIAKAGDIAKAFQETFATPEVLETGASLTSQNFASDTSSQDVEQKHTKNPEDKERKQDIKVEYFTMKNPDTFGFK